MISIWRISSSHFPANSGEGAALYGGRWNRIGTPAIYAAQSASLAALEVLVHFSVVPKDQVLTEIQIPESLAIERWEEDRMPEDWNSWVPAAATQEMGEVWVREARSAVLCVPSTVIPGEKNFVLNPVHPAFREIRFNPSQPFRFDPRLK
ncbi:MAG: RES family NAD+ phosphorylase [Terracidiphilus sp.]